MRSVVGPLLLGLGPLVAVGCALPERTLSRADDLGFRQKQSLEPRVSHEPKVSSELSFIAPKAPGRADIAARTEREPFHSAELERFNVQPAAGRSNDDPSKNPIQLQGLKVDDSNSASQQSISVQSNRGMLATDRSNGDSGLAKLEDSTTDPKIQPWANRPGIRHIEQPVSASGINAGTSVSGRQTSLSNLPQLPSISNASGALPWQADLEQLIVRVERDLAQSKPDSDGDRQNDFLRKQAHLRLLYLMAQRQEEALTAIAGAESSQQEYWQQMIWAMSNSLDTVQFPEPSERAGQTVPPLSAALRQMREHAALSIKNMTFCRKISYFGNYERFPRNEFTPGYEVLLYTEIENFVSTPTVDGEYRTSLKSLIEIADSAGKIVWTKGFPSTEDFCRNPRRDYFHNYQFYIPEDLSTGAYTLKLTIVDELSHKRVSNSLNFVLK